MPTNNPRLSSVLTLCLCAISMPALAERPRWAPVVLDMGTKPQSLDVVTEFGEALASRLPGTLLAPEEAAKAYRETYSREPATLDDDQAGALRDELRAAITQASLRRWEQAKRFDVRFSELEPAAQDEFLVRTGLARDVFGLCVMTALPLIEAGHEAAAVEHAKKCLQRQPALAIDVEREFTERTREVLTRAQAELHAQGAATLQLEVDGAAPCALFVNGTRWEAVDPPRELPPAPVRIQARCEQPGRIRTFELTSGLNTLSIDPRRDRAVRSEGYLALQYTDSAEAFRHRQADSAALARDLGVQAALLIEPTLSGDLVVRLLDPAGDTMGPGPVVLSANQTPSELAAVADGFAAGLIGGKRFAPSETMATAGNQYSETPFDDTGWSFSVVDAAAITAGAAGIAGLIASWTYYDLRRQYRTAVADDNVGYQPQYIAQGKNAMLLNISGAALLSASAPLLLPDYDDAPAIPWIAGGLGLATVAAGSYLSAVGQACERDHCPTGDPDSLLGPMVLVHSIPLLSVPVTYAVRSLLSDPDLEIQATPTTGGANLRLKGRY